MSYIAVGGSHKGSKETIGAVYVIHPPGTVACGTDSDGKIRISLKGIACAAVYNESENVILRYKAPNFTVL